MTILMTLCVTGVFSSGVLAQQRNNIRPIENNTAVKDAVGQFQAIKNNGEWIAALPDSSIRLTGGTSKDHYQGISRVPYREGSQNNTFFVTKSGDLGTNYLGTVEIGSTQFDPDKSALHGERLGSNLFQKGQKPGNSIPYRITGSGIVFDDKVVYANSSLEFKHPGGTQNVGDILAVPWEQPLTVQFYDHPVTGLPQPTNSRVYFYDTRIPSQPRRLNYFLDMIEAEAALSQLERAAVTDRTGKERIEAGVVAMTKLPNGKYMLMVTYALDAVVAVFVSNESSFFKQAGNNTWVENDNFRFEFYDMWFAEEQFTEATTNGFTWTFSSWPWSNSSFTKDKLIASFQQLSLINQTNGYLYLMGSFNTSKAAPAINGDDLVRLFEVRGYPGDPNDSSGEIKIYYRAERHLRMSSGDGTKHGNANAGIGAYVSPTRELILYGVHHYESPKDMLRISEYRHRDMAFADNRIGAKFRPNHMGAQITLKKGQSVTLDASSRFISSWVDFYEDSVYNGSNGSRRVIFMDANHQSKDDYDNFGNLDNFHDKMTSYRGALEGNYALAMYQDSDFDKPFFAKGRFASSRNGSQVISTNIGSTYNDELSSARLHDVAFLYNYNKNSNLIQNPNKDHNLALIFTQQQLGAFHGINMTFDEINDRRQYQRRWQWDLDGNGSYETTTSGPTVTFNANKVGTFNVRVRFNNVEKDIDGNWVQKSIKVEPADVAVPDLYGMSIPAAVNALDNVNLEFGNTSYAYNSDMPIDFVIDQSIAKGTMVQPGTHVNTVVSRGLEGDIDLDGDVDLDDINLIKTARNTPANHGFDRRDLDGDGMVTALDARKVALLCTRPRCAS